MPPQFKAMPARMKKDRGERKKEIGRKRGEELRDWLQQAGQTRVESNSHADWRPHEGAED